MKYPEVDFNKGCSKYGFPLHMAVQAEDFNIALKLLNAKFRVDIHKKDSEENTVLHYLVTHYSADPEKSRKIA